MAERGTRGSWRICTLPVGLAFTQTAGFREAVAPLLERNNEVAFLDTRPPQGEL